MRTRIDVGRLVLHRGAVVVLGGVVPGVLGAALAGPFLAHLLYGVSPDDPVALRATPVLVMVAMWLRARRARALDPMTALPSEQHARNQTTMRSNSNETHRLCPDIPFDRLSSAACHAARTRSPSTSYPRV